MNRERNDTLPMPNGRSVEINEKFRAALDVLENTNKNIFITGRAGTGKSTLLEYFRLTTKKNVAVLAPTGVAALNVKGQTIHSFFGFRPDVTQFTVRKKRGSSLYRSLDMIIIDEISMVRADLLDCIDKFMRLNGKDSSLPFGGVQMAFVGDLYQLSPIVTYREKKMFKEYYASEYFFDANAFNDLDAEFVELDKCYRQDDAHFIELLNAVRNNTATEVHLKELNKRFDPSFSPMVSDGYITLVPINRLADEINNANLAKLKTETFAYKARFKGDFDIKSLPAEERLYVKVGSQVMLLNNDKDRRWVNGSVGYIAAINQEDGAADVIIVRFADGSTAEVTPHTWELFRFSYDAGSRRLIPEVIGSFTQYPMMLAWAVTIHKSQGKTFDKMIVDVGSGTFANGQLYVALSRCVSLEGIILKKRLEKRHIFTDWRVVRFITRYQYGKSEKKMPLREKKKLIEQAIKSGKSIEILYLKANDEKSRRIVKPSKIGRFDYMGMSYSGMSGFDSKRKEERNFRIERILEIKTIE